MINHAKATSFATRLSGRIFIILGLIVMLGCLRLFSDAGAIEHLAVFVSRLKEHTGNYQVELWYIDKLNYIVRALFFSGVLVFLSGTAFVMREKVVQLMRAALSPSILKWLNHIILKYGFWNLYLTIFAFLIGIYLRTDWFLAPRSFWNNSYCLALALMRVSWNEISGQLPLGQQAPLGFVIVSKIIGELFRYNEYALLFIPFVAGIASAILFLIISVKLLHPKVVFLATFLWALNPALIFYTGEFKQYSTDVFFTLLLFLLALRTVKNSFKSGLPAMMTTGVIALFFSHSAVFVLAGCGSTFIFTVFSLPGNIRMQTSVRLAKAAVLWIVSFWFIYFMYISKSTHNFMYTYHAGGFVSFDSIHDFMIWSSQTFKNAFIFPLGMAPRWASFLWPVGALLTVAGIVISCKRNSGITCGGITMLFFLLLASALGKYPVNTGDSVLTPRLILFAVPFFLIWISEGADSCIHGLGLKKYFAVFTGLLLSGIMFVSWATTFYIRQEVGPLVDAYRKNKGIDDIIWVYPGAITAFEYNTRLSPMPYCTGLIDNGGGTVPEDSMYDSLKPLLQRTGRIWILFSQSYENEEQKVFNFINKAGCKKVSEIQTAGAMLFCYETQNK